jgi:hypothetical protein
VRQRDEYKDKLGGASPDEAKRRIDRLEAEINALKPRKLTDDQKVKLQALLFGLSGSVSIASELSVGDARVLAKDLIDAFHAAGWYTENPGVIGPANPPPSGIAIRVNDPNHLGPKHIVILNAMRSIGLRFDLQLGNLARPLNMQPLDAEILISQKDQ